MTHLCGAVDCGADSGPILEQCPNNRHDLIGSVRIKTCVEHLDLLTQRYQHEQNAKWTE